MSNYLPKDIKKIIILPMKYDEDEAIEDVQENYFEYRLPIEEKWWYKYYKKGLNCESNDLIFFQYKNHIIASGLFDMRLSFTNHPEFNGAIVLIKNSIKTFKPISINELQQFFDITKFGNTRKGINRKDIKDMVALIERLEVKR